MTSHQPWRGAGAWSAGISGADPSADRAAEPRDAERPAVELPAVELPAVERKANHAARPATALATTARTALAATHGGRLRLPGGWSEDVGFLDDDGEPLLLLCGDGPPLRGSACLSVAAGPTCRVVLGGRLQTLDSEVGDLAELLGNHAPCFADALHMGPVQIVRLAVEEIRVEDGSGSRSVSCADYAVAEPDLWEAFAATVAEHLDSDHRDLLAHLARLHLPGQQVVAVAIAGLEREVLTLDVVTPDGANRIPLQLNADLTDPHELCGRLLDIASPPAPGDGPGGPGGPGDGPGEPR
jgi:hypothetical protein